MANATGMLHSSMQPAGQALGRAQTPDQHSWQALAFCVMSPYCRANWPLSKACENFSSADGDISCNWYSHMIMHDSHSFKQIASKAKTFVAKLEMQLAVMHPYLTLQGATYVYTMGRRTDSL